MQEIPYEHEEKNLFCEGYIELEQAAQGGCGIFFCRDIQNISGHFLMKASLGNLL